jgi:hypothetical protein
VGGIINIARSFSDAKTGGVENAGFGATGAGVDSGCTIMPVVVAMTAAGAGVGVTGAVPTAFSGATEGGNAAPTKSG